MGIQEIAKALLSIREKKGISQYYVEGKGMNRMTVRAIEEGKNVTIENLFKYCEIIGAEIVIKEKEGH